MVRIFTALLITAALLSGPAAAQSDAKTVYAVFWRGCEEVCQGFQEYFSAKGVALNMIIRDAGRDRAKLSGFLEEARRLKPDLILTWGTSTTLGIAGTLDDVGNQRFNNDIDQVFTVVADPVGSRIIRALDATGRANLTGTLNRVPEAVNINTLRAYNPAFQRLGLLYNTNESNSVLKQQELAALAGSMNFELVAAELELGEDGKPKPADIPVKMAGLKQKGVDFVYLGSSSFLNVQGDLFTKAAMDHGLPVLSPYERLVRGSQALISVAARYRDVGQLAAMQAEKILFEGRTPGDLPVAAMTQFAYVINMGVARKLNLFPPVAILQFAETVNADQ